MIRSISIGVVATVLLSSCQVGTSATKAISSAYRYRNAMMTGIGKEEGCETCWNSLEDLRVGGIYRLNGPLLSYCNYSWFEDSLKGFTEEKDITSGSPNGREWSHTITKNKDVDITLSYLGLGLAAKNKGTKKIVFTAEGDRYMRIKNEDDLEDVLNSMQGTGTKLREHILEDTVEVRRSQEEFAKARLAGVKNHDLPAVKLPKYWIAARGITAKNFDLKLLTTHDNSIKLDVSDPNKLAGVVAKKLKVSGITVSGSSGGTSIGSTDTQLGTNNIAATLYPLTAIEAVQDNGSKVIKIRIDTSKQALTAANLNISL